MIVFIGALVVSIIIVGLIILLTETINEWQKFNSGDLKSKSYGGIAQLTWKQLVNFYSVNPKRWRYEYILGDGFDIFKNTTKALLYNGGSSWDTERFNDIYLDRDKIVRIQLSFIDYIKFSWCAKHTKSYGGLSVVLKSVNKDIDDLRKISQAEIEKANKSMKEITQRMMTSE